MNLNFFSRAGLISAFFLSFQLSAAVSSLHAAARQHQDPPDPAFFSIDLGAYANQLDEQLATQNILSNVGNNVVGYLRMRVGIPLFHHLYLEPSLGSLLPWRASSDGSTKIFTFNFALDLTYRLFSFLRLRLGPGILSSLYVPGDEPITLNNGTSTSTFYSADRFAATAQFGLQGGLQFVFCPEVSLLMEAYVIDPASALRQLNSLVSLGFEL